MIDLVDPIEEARLAEIAERQRRKKRRNQILAIVTLVIVVATGIFAYSKFFGPEPTIYRHVILNHRVSHGPRILIRFPHRLVCFDSLKAPPQQPSRLLHQLQQLRPQTVQAQPLQRLLHKTSTKRAANETMPTQPPKF
jgi:hypothetical protein